MTGNTDPRVTPIIREYGHGSICLSVFPSSQRVGVETQGTNPVMDSHEFIEFADLIEGAAGFVRVKVDDETVERVASTTLHALFGSCPDCAGSGMVLDEQASMRAEQAMSMQCERCAYLDCGLGAKLNEKNRVAEYVARAVLAALRGEP